MQIILAVKPGQAKRLSFRHSKAFVFDAPANRIWNNGLWIKLAPCEFKVALAVAVRRGELISKAEICDALWGDREDGGPDTQWKAIDVHVNRLRGKLPVMGLSIFTHWGRGLRLVHEVQAPAVELRRAA
jgi:DNA-binding response OmpR family regulator